MTAKKFKVRGSYTEYYEAEVSAIDGHAANRHAIENMDQADFEPRACGGQWWIEDEEPAEEIKPSHWAVDPDYPVADWQAEVARNDTRQSYAEWVESCRNLTLPIAG